MKEPIKKMLETQKELGHKGPRICYVDNPSQSQWLLDEIPSLKKYQEYLDSLTSDHENDSDDASNTNTSDDENLSANTNVREAGEVSPQSTMVECIESGEVPLFDDIWFEKNVMYISKHDAINNHAMGLLGILNLNNPNSTVVVELGFDLEWYVPNIDGVVIGAGEKTDLAQIAYIENGIIKVVLYQLTGLHELPFHFKALLKHPCTRFVGSLVSGDLARLNREHANLNIDVELKAMNLENMAKSRGLVLSSKGLDGIVFALFGVRVSKSLRLEKWNVKQLPIKLQKYAAFDAAWSLASKLRLFTMPNLTLPLHPSNIMGGMEVDVAPYAAAAQNIFQRGCRIAAGVIVRETQKWENIPPNLDPTPNMRSGDKQGWYLVEITEVIAPAMKIKDLRMKYSRRFATFADLGEVPFRVCLPVEMLRSRTDARPNALTQTKVHIDVHEEHVETRNENQTFIDLLEEIPASDEINDDDVEHEHNILMGNLDDGDKVALVEDCLRKGVQGGISLPGSTATSNTTHLNAPPDTIKDKYSAVNGSHFHGENRFDVPKDHMDEKAFYSALSEALFAWDSVDLQKLFETMKDAGMVTEWRDFLLLRYYRRMWFCQRVKRHCLSPSKLYWRVRAVFEVFGSRVDSKSNKPLFNKTCWKKANNLLNEILKGYYSDPPGIDLYKLKMKKGTRIIDYDERLGIPKLSCLRDTNSLESEHGRMNQTAGKRQMGLEYGDHLLAERRFRSTIEASKKNRLDFPQINHYNPWLMDILQNRVEEKHSILIYPSWINTSMLSLRTDEKFGFVSLASPELSDHINDNVNLPDSYKMPSSLEFLSKRTGFIIAPQPWGPSKEERKLYPQLLLQEEQIGGSQEQQCIRMCYSILPNVNGIITPKIPVYNRLQAARYSRNTRIQASVNELKRQQDALSAINILTEIEVQEIEQCDERSIETRAVAKKRKVIDYMKTSFPTNQNIPIQPRPSARMPQPIQLPNPFAFQPLINHIPFVQNIPVMPLANSYQNSEQPRSGPRSAVRTCLLFCRRTDCKGGNRRWPNGACKYCLIFAMWVCYSFDDLRLNGWISLNLESSSGLSSEERKKIIAFALFLRKQEYFISV